MSVEVQAHMQLGSPNEGTAFMWSTRSRFTWIKLERLTPT
jgi:hypothetical protein